jgi:lipopolysaccharide export system protein LptA
VFRGQRFGPGNRPPGAGSLHRFGRAGAHETPFALGAQKRWRVPQRTWGERSALQAALELAAQVGHGGSVSGAARVGAWLGAVIAMAIAAGAALVRAEPVAVVDGQPVAVVADQLVVDLHKGTAVMTGNVRVQRGELELRCDRVDARYNDAPNITWAKATGNVSADWKGTHAKAKEAELFLTRRLLVLRGGVKLARGGAWIEAREAQVDFGSGKLTLEQVAGSILVPSALPAVSSQPRGADSQP